ncbi:MAG: PLP-dependent aspartate aminotransferase family protein [Spirochaetaceae bacterium]|jgi:cystathionine beta-lyase|nr:PLP-dependent aspartate aminotransferase family protein [Spirochaetaceae bacterium]
MDDPTFILHHLHEGDLPNHAVSPPIFQTSIFSYPGYEEFREVLRDESHRFLYTRGLNPTVLLAEQKIAALEKAEEAKILSSGVSAISHGIMAFVKAGDHVVCVEDCYGWTRTLLSSYLPRFNVSVTYVDGTDSDAVIRAFKPETRVIYLESPSSLTFKLQDLPVIAAAAKERHIKTITDNTWATPIFCNPLSMGIDLVLHSGSKYFSGASDIVAGVIAGSREDIERIRRQEFSQLGTVPDPFMVWLMLRGMRTLHIRMKAHYESALRVAAFLEKHPKVERVFYPLLDSYDQRELARKLFRGGSGLFSFTVRTRNLADIKKFTDAFRLFKRAVSWGGYESLVFPAAIATPREEDIPPDRLNLIRLHIGLENPDLLIEDLEGALKHIG